MSKRIRMIQFLILAAFGLSLTACDNAIFSSSSNNNGNKATGVVPPGTGGPGPVTPAGDLVFLDDSFEREDLVGDVANNMIVGWRGAWEDHGNRGLGFTGNQLGMEILSAAEQGPAFDGERATYFYGRPGSSVHRLWLVSPAYDLSSYNTVIMNYRYLTIALNDQADIDANYIEAIRLQVCAASTNDCGANADFINLDNIGNDANWVTVAESDINENDDSFDGTNHTVADFITDLAVFDLNNADFVGDKSEVVIRFEVDMRDGFANQGGTSNPNYNKEKCEIYTKKAKDYCGKEKYKCKKAKRLKHRCDKAKKHHTCDKHKKHNDSGYELLTSTYKNDKHHNCGCKKNRKGRLCRKAKHYENKCEHYGNKCDHYTAKKKKYCEKGEPNNDRTLVDGVILDLVQGIATERDISEIF